MGIVRPWSRLPFAGIAFGLALAAPAQVLAEPLAEPNHPSTQADEVLFSVLATATNIFYVPLKVAIAAVAMPAGGIAGAFSGGDARTAYSIWVPALGGTFFLTNAHMDGSKPIEFFGSDYADQPLPVRPGQDESVIFDNVATGVYQQPTQQPTTTAGTYGNYATAPYGNTTTQTYQEPYR
jgi:hypothetical protein